MYEVPICNYVFLLASLYHMIDIIAALFLRHLTAKILIVFLLNFTSIITLNVYLMLYLAFLFIKVFLSYILPKYLALIFHLGFELCKSTVYLDYFF